MDSHMVRASELLRKIAQLQIHTKKLLRGASAGSYLTRRLGTGSEFDQLREYQDGDNVRSIDWKSSARSNKLIVRSYREDRNRTIVLLIDTSPSGLFSSGNQLKLTAIQDLAVMMGFAAEQARDRFGAIFFHQTVEKVIPLGAGKSHSVLLAQAAFEAVSTQDKQISAEETSLSAAFARTMEQFPKNALVVLISDCVSSDYQTVMATVAQQHELVVLRVYDAIEREVPADLLIQFQDPETGATVNGTDPHALAALRTFTQKWYADQDLFFKKLGVDCADINVNAPYDTVLIQFFAQRGF